MGSDNLFHRQKARSAHQLARRKAKRSPYAKVLIVCEGEKTEPNYFNSLKDYYGLNSANVEVTGDCGSDPRSILTLAKQRYREAKDAGDSFDKVYCVFDKDNHTTYNEAIDQISRATPKNTYIATTSVPCFEYWLLLHYNCTTRSYESLPGNSACNQVVSELKTYIPGYSKGQADLFPALIDQLERARNYAERALLAAESNHTDNPTTGVHELVDFLQKIKERRDQ